MVLQYLLKTLHAESFATLGTLDNCSHDLGSKVKMAQANNGKQNVPIGNNFNVPSAHTGSPQYKRLEQQNLHLYSYWKEDK